MRTTQETIKEQGLNYQWFIDETLSIVRELNQGKIGNVSKTYLAEKLRKVESILELI